MIRQKLDEIEAYIVATHHVAESQQPFVEGQFEYLKDAVDRLGKRDWINICANTLMGLALTQIVPADSIGNILRFAWTALEVFFGNAPSLPPVPPPP